MRVQSTKVMGAALSLVGAALSLAGSLLFSPSVFAHDDWSDQ